MAVLLSYSGFCIVVFKLHQLSAAFFLSNTSAYAMCERKVKSIQNNNICLLIMICSDFIVIKIGKTTISVRPVIISRKIITESTQASLNIQPLSLVASVWETGDQT